MNTGKLSGSRVGIGLTQNKRPLGGGEMAPPPPVVGPPLVGPPPPVDGAVVPPVVEPLVEPPRPVLGAVPLLMHLVPFHLQPKESPIPLQPDSPVRAGIATPALAQYLEGLLPHM